MKSKALIEKLVSFNTTSHLSNMELIRFIEEYLDHYGISSELIYNTDKSKANLLATIGNPEQPGILLSGHTDVVPVYGQDWLTDPFILEEKNERFYGRGSADMKSFIAVVMSFVPDMLKLDLQSPVHLSFSYDEEIGCIGVRSLLERLKHFPVLPKFCIVGEPTNMHVINGHKGKTAFHVAVYGKECHSGLSVKDGVNAVEYAAEIIVFIKSLQRKIAENGPFDTSYDIPYTILNTGPISGGRTINIVPNNCDFEFEIRNIPNDNPEEYINKIMEVAKTILEPEMHKLNNETGINFTKTIDYPGLFTDPDSEAISFAKSLTGESDTGKINFGTEGGLFHSINIPSVICGPGSIEQAHKPNEFITFEQVLRCEQMMENLLSYLTTGSLR